MREVLEAEKLLKKDWGIEAGIWNVTSFSELRRDAEETERWNLLHSAKTPKKSHLEKCLSKNNVPTVAVSDYVKMVSEQIGPYVPGNFYALGTDGFGRSDTRENLRRFFEVDRYYIVLTAAQRIGVTYYPAPPPAPPPAPAPPPPLKGRLTGQTITIATDGT